MTSTPDILAAVRQMLLDDAATSALVSDRIWGSDIDRAEIPNMPRANIVVSLGGRVPSPGDSSYVAVERLRVDVRCYGADAAEARSVYRSVDALMRAIVPRNVDMSTESVRVHNAIPSGGPVSMTDPDADWPSVVASWGISASDVSIPAQVISS